MSTSPVVDLHSHTRHSDGELTVSELLQHAVRHGVEIFSITDHDSVAAYREIPSTIQMRILPGAEFSCQLEGMELHLVALGVDVDSNALNNLIMRNQETRKERANWIIARLIKLGYPDISDSMQQLVTGEVVCRTHLAKALVKMGIAKDFKSAFKRYLGRSGKVWRRADWPGIQVVIDTIRQAGGKAVLAHPTKYRYSASKMSYIIEKFAQSGGDAIETNYAGLNLNHKAWLSRLAHSHNLMVSVGSDFHHMGQTWAVPGRFSQIAKDLTPVWTQ